MGCVASSASHSLVRSHCLNQEWRWEQVWHTLSISSTPCCFGQYGSHGGHAFNAGMMLNQQLNQEMHSVYFFPPILWLLILSQMQWRIFQPQMMTNTTCIRFICLRTAILMLYAAFCFVHCTWSGPSFPDASEHLYAVRPSSLCWQVIWVAPVFWSSPWSWYHFHNPMSSPMSQCHQSSPSPWYASSHLWAQI